MSQKPVLVLQPRRLGDLILTFPLLQSLQLRFPGHPVQVVARQEFFEPLLPFAPKATFFPLTQLPPLLEQEYEAVINLGGDGKTAIFTSEARADLKLGSLRDKDSLTVNGYWQLYREGLTQNNRHNIFHWADLFRLDLKKAIQARREPARAGRGRIGLFVGASDPAKRPGAQFWAETALWLARLGFKPVLLGGPDDVAMGMAIMAKGAKAANFCGKTSIAQLAALLKTLDLLLTPDTGPMHLADWLGVPVLNISLGNVHAAETGPLAPGQHILRANMSCVGCWHCSRKNLFCRSAFDGRAVARLAEELVAAKPCLSRPRRLELLKTGSDDLGLYRLQGDINLRSQLETFWQSAFLYFADPVHAQRLKIASESLLANQRPVVEHMRSNFGKMLAYMAQSSKRGQPLPADFWRNQPWHSRLFAGNLQMSLQNSAFSRAAFMTALGRIDSLQAVLAARNPA